MQVFLKGLVGVLSSVDVQLTGWFVDGGGAKGPLVGGSQTACCASATTEKVINWGRVVVVSM